jgi:SpoVK/Ycf46/Vps4 family AAA+-type ATPase
VAIDLSTGILKQFREAEYTARQHLARGEFTHAAKYLRQCNQLMRRYAEQPNTGETVRRMRLERAEHYLTLALQAESQLKRGDDEPTPLAALPERNASNDYQAIIEGLITRVNVRWHDIGGLERTKEEIQLNYALGLVRYPDGLSIQPTRRLLFYGPPGTGKTMLAAAISNELEATFFNVRIPDMMSQYFGESSKLINALYSTAAQHAPSGVFVDEMDALGKQRGSGQESGAERRLLNTFLGELDGLQNKRDETPLILTVGATNMPWELDRAILSRFGGGMIYVPLPDDAARQAILDLYITAKGHHSRVPYAQLVERTYGYSGREIEQIVLRQVANGQDALRTYELRAEALGEEDFRLAFGQIKPATTAAQIRRYEEWGRDWE